MRSWTYKLYRLSGGHLGLTGWGVSAAGHVAALTAGMLFSSLWIFERATSAGAVSVVSLHLEAVQTEEQFEPPDVPIRTQVRDPSKNVPTIEAIESKLTRDDESFYSVSPPELPATELAVVADIATATESKPKRPTETTVARSSSSVTRPARRVDSRRPTPPAPKIDATAVGVDETIPARPLENRPPEYPEEAIRRGIVGRLVLKLTISASGTVSHVEVAESSGYRMLDEAAVAAVREWEFAPARRGGRPVSWTARQPIRFRRR